MGATHCLESILPTTHDTKRSAARKPVDVTHTEERDGAHWEYRSNGDIAMYLPMLTCRPHNYRHRCLCRWCSHRPPRSVCACYLSPRAAPSNRLIPRRYPVSMSEKPQPAPPADDDEARFDDEGSAVGHSEPDETEQRKQKDEDRARNPVTKRDEF